MDHFTVAVLVSQNPRPANNQGPEKFKEKIHKIKSSPKEGFKAIYLIAVYKANNQGPEKFREKIHKIKSSPKESFKAIYLIAVYKEPLGSKLESLSFLFLKKH